MPILTPTSLVLIICLLVTVTLIITIMYSTNNNTDNIINKAYAHFTGGATKNIDNYQVIFLLYPTRPVVGDNSTKLNFSILDKDKNTDVYGIFASLAIKDKKTQSIIEQTPYKFHEFGDITFPYTFKNNTDYEVILQAKISNDPKYENTPLAVSFDISAVNPNIASFEEIVIYYAIPIIALMGTALIVLKILRRRKYKS